MMGEDTKQQGCRKRSWIAAGVIGVIVALFALGGGKGIVAALVLGALAFVLLAQLFIWMGCAPVAALTRRKPRTAAVVMPDPAPEPVAAPEPAPVAAKAPETAEPEEPAVAKAPEPASAAESAAEPLVKPSKALAGEQELAGRKGNWRYEGEAEAGPAAEAAPETAEAAPETAQTAPESGDAGSGSEPAKPEALSAPRDSGADNLKEIKGVGPKLEALLHELGIYHFDQIARWSAAEVAWMDSNLAGFRGRVSRDDWIGQAKILAAGGETDFSRRVDGGSVY